jgi:hypothetical protein
VNVTNVRVIDNDGLVSDEKGRTFKHGSNGRSGREQRAVYSPGSSAQELQAIYSPGSSSRELQALYSPESSRRDRRAVQSPGSSTSGNEIVRGPGKVGGRCLTQEEEPEIKYFYLNQNPEEVKILSSDNPTQRRVEINYSQHEIGSKSKSCFLYRISRYFTVQKVLFLL